MYIGDVDRVPDAQHTADAAVAARLKGLRVLHVDDNATNRFIARRHLASWETDFREASGGEEAIALARERDFDVILMDLRMPDLHGAEAARAIRAMPRHRDTPIYAVSAGSLPESNDAAEAAVFRGLLHKPYAAAQLQSVLLGLGAGDGEPTDPPTGGAPPANQVSTVDMRALRQEFAADGAEDELHALLRIMIDDLTRSRANLVEAVAGGETDYVDDEQHRLKTTTRMLRPEPLTRLLAEATEAAHQPAPELAERIDRALGQTIQLLVDHLGGSA